MQIRRILQADAVDFRNLACRQSAHLVEREVIYATYAAEWDFCCRLNFFPQRWLKVPKLDIEIFYFFGKINLYANMNPRANLASPQLDPTALVMLTGLPVYDTG